MLVMIAALLVVIGPLIFVHELGHFLVAKAAGIQVLRFSLGFGRPLVAWKWGETEYWISWIPLGGYVKMAGLEDEGMAGELEGGKSNVPVDPARAFDRKPLWARMAVILAGVTMNLVFAFIIYAGLTLTLGEPRLALVPIDSVNATGLPPGTEGLATLRHGDRILRINGDTVATWNELQDRLLEGPDTIRLEVEGRSAPVVVSFPRGGQEAREQAVRALRPLLPAKIGVVNPGQPAARVGLRGGDIVIRAGADSVRSWDEMVRAVRRSPGKPLALQVLRGDSVFPLTVVPEIQTEADSAGRPDTIGVIGAAPDPRLPVVRVPVGVTAALVGAVEQTAWQVGAIATTIKRLVLGQLPARDLGGPILIAQMSGQMVRLGLDAFLRFIAFFSVSLAVLNLLPIPVLDGGQAVFLLAEAVLRRPLSLRLRMRLTQVGFFVILGIMALAIANDVLRNIPR
jgi:regulator of sigma E protease